MPELPEVETVKRALDLVMAGRVIERVEVHRPDLRIPLPGDFAVRLHGRRVTAPDRRGKYLRAGLDDGQTLIMHLGMSGGFVLNGARPPGAHDHLRFFLDDGAVITFRDARRFGFMALAQTALLADHAFFRHLGPEPLDPDFDGVAIAARLNGRRTPIKTALMDQRVVAGIGNIYASEALYRAGISPRRLAQGIRGRRAEKLAASLKATLEEAIAAGGSSLRDHVHPDGTMGRFQWGFRVYGRAGKPCPGCVCTTGVRRIVQAGRATFFCPGFQR